MKIHTIDIDFKSPGMKRLSVPRNSTIGIGVKPINESIDDMTLQDGDICLVPDDPIDGYYIYKIDTGNQDREIEVLIRESKRTGIVIDVDEEGLFERDQELELPVATANQLGGVKVGTGLAIDENGILSVTGGSSQKKVVFGPNWSGNAAVGSGSVCEYYPGQQVPGDTFMAGCWKGVDLTGGVPAYYELIGDLSADHLAMENYPVYKVTVHSNWQASDYHMIVNRQPVPKIYQADHEYRGVAFINCSNLYQYKFDGQSDFTAKAGELQLSGNVTIAST